MTQKVERYQCDQMAILFHSLAIYKIENLPSDIKITKVGTKVCQLPN